MLVGTMLLSCPVYKQLNSGTGLYVAVTLEPHTHAYSYSI